MAETVRSVLIKFRVDAPNLQTVGNVGGGIGTIGGPAAASPLSVTSPSGVGNGTDVNREMLDALDKLTSAVDRLTVVLPLLSAAGGGGGGGLINSLGPLASRGGAALSRIGAGAARAAPFVAGAGAAALAVGATGYLGFQAVQTLRGAGGGILDDDDPGFGFRQINRAIGVGLAARDAVGFISDLPETFPGALARGLDITTRRANTLFGRPNPLSNEEAARIVNNRILGRAQGLQVGQRTGRQEALQRRFGDQLDTFGLRGGFTAEGTLAAGERRLGIQTRRLSRTQADASFLAQGDIGAGPAGVGERIGRRLEIERDLLDRRLEVAREETNLARQRISLLQQSFQELQSIAGNALGQSPARLERVAEIVERSRSGQALNAQQRLFALDNFNVIPRRDRERINQGITAAFLASDIGKRIGGDEFANIQRQVTNAGFDSATVADIAQFIRTGWTQAIQQIVDAHKDAILRQQENVNILEGQAESIAAGAARALGDGGAAQGGRAGE